MNEKTIIFDIDFTDPYILDVKRRICELPFRVSFTCLGLAPRARHKYLDLRSSSNSPPIIYS